MPTRSVARTITRDPAVPGPAVHPGEVRGRRGVTADTALRLARFFKTTPQVWMHLQADWDLHQALRRGSAA